MKAGGTMNGGFHNVLKMLGFLNVFRSLEHHMLEEMRESRPPLALVPRADVVINGDRYNRYRLVAVKHDPEAV
jgi:hypothetical protein